MPPGADKWKPSGSTGFQYRDAAGFPRGAGKVVLKAGADGKAKIGLQAGGPNLPDGLLPITSTPVVGQLVRADVGTCFEGRYDVADVKADDGVQFKASAR